MEAGRYDGQDEAWRIPDAGIGIRLLGEYLPDHTWLHLAPSAHTVASDTKDGEENDQDCYEQRFKRTINTNDNQEQHTTSTKQHCNISHLIILLNHGCAVSLQIKSVKYNVTGSMISASKPSPRTKVVGIGATE